MKLARLGALALLVAGLGACASTPGDGVSRQLEIAIDPAAPAHLLPGTVVRITAKPVPEAEMAWVSGTVKILGAPVMGLKQDPKDGQWRFKTMIPPMVSVPAGRYDVKVWGRTKSGQDVKGQTSYEVQ